MTKKLALALLLITTACGTLDTDKPVGIGRDIDEYKRSPCACNEIPQDYSNWQKSASQMRGIVNG